MAAYTYNLRRIGNQYQVRGLPALENISLEQDCLKFGRNPEQVDVVLNSSVYANMISREHAEIRRSKLPDGTVVYHLHDRSLNGTYVNDFRVAGQTLLQPGDVIQFGHINGAAVRPGEQAPQPDAEFTYVLEKSPRQPAPFDANKMMTSLLAAGNRQASATASGSWPPAYALAAQAHPAYLAAAAAASFSNPYFQPLLNANQASQSSLAAAAAAWQSSGSQNMSGRSVDSTNHGSWLGTVHQNASMAMAGALRNAPYFRQQPQMRNASPAMLNTQLSANQAVQQVQPTHNRDPRIRTFSNIVDSSQQYSSDTLKMPSNRYAAEAAKATLSTAGTPVQNVPSPAYRHPLDIPTEYRYNGASESKIGNLANQTHNLTVSASSPQQNVGYFVQKQQPQVQRQYSSKADNAVQRGESHFVARSEAAAFVVAPPPPYTAHASPSATVVKNYASPAPPRLPLPPSRHSVVVEPPTSASAMVTQTTSPTLTITATPTVLTPSIPAGTATLFSGAADQPSVRSPDTTVSPPLTSFAAAKSQQSPITPAAQQSDRAPSEPSAHPVTEFTARATLTPTPSPADAQAVHAFPVPNVECDSSVPSPPGGNETSEQSIEPVQDQDAESHSLNQDLYKLATLAQSRCQTVADVDDMFEISDPVGAKEAKSVDQDNQCPTKTAIYSDAGRSGTMSPCSPRLRSPSPPTPRKRGRPPASGAKTPVAAAVVVGSFRPARSFPTAVVGEKRKSNEVARLLNDLSDSSFMFELRKKEAKMNRQKLTNPKRGRPAVASSTAAARQAPAAAGRKRGRPPKQRQSSLSSSTSAGDEASDGEEKDENDDEASSETEQTKSSSESSDDEKLASFGAKRPTRNRAAAVAFKPPSPSNRSAKTSWRGLTNAVVCRATIGRPRKIFAVGQQSPAKNASLTRKSAAGGRKSRRRRTTSDEKSHEDESVDDYEDFSVDESSVRRGDDVKKSSVLRRRRGAAAAATTQKSNADDRRSNAATSEDDAKVSAAEKKTLAEQATPLTTTTRKQSVGDRKSFAATLGNVGGSNKSPASRGEATKKGGQRGRPLKLASGATAARTKTPPPRLPLKRASDALFPKKPSSSDDAMQSTAAIVITEEMSWTMHDPSAACASADRCVKPTDVEVQWVQCDDCSGWYHAVCIECDYNALKNTDEEFHCGCSSKV